MKNKATTDFIVIDDERMSNRICEIVITRTFPESDVYTFTDPAKGFEFISSAYSAPGANNVILFLDIAMPVTSGWHVLDKLTSLDAGTKKRINIYILSSSTDELDIARAKSNPMIKKFISKPILINTLSQQMSNSDFL